MSSRLIVLTLAGLMLLVGIQPLTAQAPARYLAALEAANGTQLGLALVNSNATDAQVTFTARTYGGQLIAGAGIVNPNTLNVGGGAKIELLLSDIFGNGISGNQGWLEIDSSTSGIKTYSFVFDSGLTFVEGVDATSDTSNELIFPKVNPSTTLNIVNTSTSPLTATISLVDNSGAASAVVPISLPAQSGISAPAAGIFSGSTTFAGYAVLQTSGNGSSGPAGLVGFETYRNKSDIAAVRGIPAREAMQGGFWSHFASQDGYASRLVLINTSGISQSIDISATTAAGIVTVTKTLSPYERTEDEVAALFGLSAQSVIDGYIQFATESNTASMLGMLEYSTTDGMSLSAGEPAAQPQSDSYFVHLAEGAGFYTGHVFVNPNAVSSTVLLDLFDKSGAVTASTSFDLAPGEHRAAMIGNFFQESISQVGGYIRVSADQPIFAQEIMGSANSNAFMANVPASTDALPDSFSSTVVTPSITSVSPSQADVDNLRSLNIRISGSGFSRGSTVVYDGEKMKTSVLSSALLAITISGTRMLPGTHSIQVTNSGVLSNVVKILLFSGSSPVNQPPVVNAGPDQSITLPSSATLSGSATDDGLPLNSTLVTTWSMIAGPAPVVFSNPGSTSTTVTFSTSGTYTLQLSATDGALSSSDDVVITVAAAVTTPPPPAPSPSPTGTVYYVSNSGNDSNSGTSQTSPWKTVAKVQGYLGNLKAGDAVLFQRGGIWYEELDVNNVNGASGLPITFGNYGTGNLPVIDGGGTLSGGTISGGRQWCIGGSSSKMSYLTIDGFECRNTSSYGIAFVGVSSGSVSIVVQNSYIHDTGSGDTGYHNQLMFAEYNYGHAYGTKFLNNKVGNCYGHNCIQIHGDTGSPLIQGNECYGFSHNCIDVKYTQHAVVDSNVVHDGLGNEQYENAFYIENDGTTYTMDVTWTHNVVYGSNISTAFQCEDEGGPVVCRVYNNTVYANSTGVFGGATTGSAPNVQIHVFNNIFDTTRPRDGSSYAEWDYNDNVQSSPIGAHDLSVNPLYVNAGADNFHLQSGSPVIDRGTTSVNLSYVGSAPDMGAFEYGVN